MYGLGNPEPTCRWISFDSAKREAIKTFIQIHVINFPGVVCEQFPMKSLDVCTRHVYFRKTYKDDRLIPYVKEFVFNSRLKTVDELAGKPHYSRIQVLN